MRHTLLDNIRATFLFHVWLVGKPLDTLAECVHVRILKYVDGHDDLIIPRRDDNSLMRQARGGVPYNKCEIALRVRLMSQPARWAMRAT